MDSAIEHNRKIFLSGRSMETNIRIAQHLGYIKVPRGLFINNKELKKFPEDRLIILTTGSQGEDVSALARMSMDTHSFVRIQKGDTVVLSSSPIIGNEGAIIKVINRLCKRGAKVMTNNDIDIHTSGHGKQEDLKLMIKLINPHYLIPAHGNCYMRVAHKELGEICGIPENKIFLLDNGEVVQGNFKNGYQKTNEKIPAEYIMVEGPERSPVEGAILMDRQLMAKNGVVMVLFKITKSPLGLISPPIILHRGFVYMDFSKIILDKIIQVSANAFHEFTQRNQNQQNFSEKELENYLQSSIDRELVRLLDKRPLVVPVLISG